MSMQKMFHSILRAIIQANKKLSCRRDRAMLRVTEYFVKSLKVIQNDTLENSVSPYQYSSS